MKTELKDVLRQNIQSKNAYNLAQAKFKNGPNRHQNDLAKSYSNDPRISEKKSGRAEITLAKENGNKIIVSSEVVQSSL